MSAQAEVATKYLFALCLWREARGEGVEGMRAIAWIIWNRSREWNKTLSRIIMDPNQFTSMSVESNPPSPELDDLQMAEASTIVGDLMSGIDTVDPTKGALYYANLKAATSGWFWKNIVQKEREHPETTTIGKHTFFA